MFFVCAAYRTLKNRAPRQSKDMVHHLDPGKSDLSTRTQPLNDSGPGPYQREQPSSAAQPRHEVGQTEAALSLCGSIVQ